MDWIHLNINLEVTPYGKYAPLETLSLSSQYIYVLFHVWLASLMQTRSQDFHIKQFSDRLAPSSFWVCFPCRPDQPTQPKTIDCVNNGCSITSKFVDFCFEASSLDFGRRHLGFLEPEMTIFGREGGTNSSDCWLAWFSSCIRNS